MIEFDKELQEYLKLKSPQELQQLINDSNAALSEIKYQIKEYGGNMSINDYIINVQSFEDKRLFWKQLKKEMLEKAQAGETDLHKCLQLLKLMRVQFKSPKNDFSNTKKDDEVHGSFIDNLIEEFEMLISLTSQPIEVKQQVREIKIKPIFKHEEIETIFDLLKDFFSKEHQVILKKLLETGDEADEELIFLDSGNRLADAFKQLIIGDIITGCNKKQFEGWVERNFKYTQVEQVKKFTSRYLSDIISTTKNLCKNPILNVIKQKEAYFIRKA